MAATERPFDVIVYGATGFTGRLVALHLRQHKERPRWAIAGRSKQRLQALRDSLQLPKDVGVVEANNEDRLSMEHMASKARCVINLVGPYRKYGAMNVIEACIGQKTHYVDLTGETKFVEEVIARFHQKAKQAGVVVGCSQGYDSVPSDLTSYLAVQHLKGRGVEQIGDVLASTKAGPLPLELFGAFSTGTLLSLVDAGDDDATQISFQNPGRLASAKPTSNSMPFRFCVAEPQFGRGQYGCSWILCPHNVRIVYRTWGLLQEGKQRDAYGPSFYYTETLHGGSFAFTLVQGIAFFILNFLLTHVVFFRAFLKRFLPPNAGPSDKGQARMKVNVRALAYSKTSKEASLCSLTAKGHPGYSVTAILISEIGLTLALEDQSNLHPLAQQGGVLTPSTISADRIAARLRDNGDFDIVCSRFS